MVTTGKAWGVVAIRRHGNFDNRDYRYEYVEPSNGQRLSGMLMNAKSGKDYIERAKELVARGKKRVRVVKYTRVREVIWSQEDERG